MKISINVNSQSSIPTNDSSFGSIQRLSRLALAKIAQLATALYNLLVYIPNQVSHAWKTRNVEVITDPVKIAARTTSGTQTDFAQRSSVASGSDIQKVEQTVQTYAAATQDAECQPQTVYAHQSTNTIEESAESDEESHSIADSEEARHVIEECPKARLPRITRAQMEMAAYLAIIPIGIAIGRAYAYAFCGCDLISFCRCELQLPAAIDVREALLLPLIQAVSSCVQPIWNLCTNNATDFNLGLDL